MKDQSPSAEVYYGSILEMVNEDIKGENNVRVRYKGRVEEDADE
jgi:hypothetical protein